MRKCVVVGISGCVAAFKAVQLVSDLVKLDLDVEVIMTKNACEFIQPLAFEALTNHTVMVDTLIIVLKNQLSISALRKKLTASLSPRYRQCNCENCSWSGRRYADDNLSCLSVSEADCTGNEYRHVSKSDHTG